MYNDLLPALEPLLRLRSPEPIQARDNLEYIGEGSSITGPGEHYGCIVKDGASIELEEGAVAYGLRVECGARVKLGKGASMYYCLVRDNVVVRDRGTVRYSVILNPTTVGADAVITNTRTAGNLWSTLTIGNEARLYNSYVKGSLGLGEQSVVVYAEIQSGCGCVIPNGCIVVLCTEGNTLRGARDKPIAGFEPSYRHTVPYEWVRNMPTTPAKTPTKTPLWLYDPAPLPKKCVFAPYSVVFSYVNTMVCTESITLGRGARLLMLFSRTLENCRKMHIGQIALCENAMVYAKKLGNYSIDRLVLGKNAALQIDDICVDKEFTSIVVPDNGLLTI